MSGVLVIEDNDTMREGMCEVLKKMGLEVAQASNGPDGLRLFSVPRHELVITDFKMLPMDGLDVLRKVKERAGEDEVDVIMITAYGTIDIAVEAMKRGAADFITKPFSLDEFQIKVKKVLDDRGKRKKMRALSEETEYLRHELKVRFNYGEIIGNSKKMEAVYRTIAKIADSDSSVLIYGESGTGKELVARAIHFSSRRRSKPFVRVSCGALAEGVLESELFGHEKGAFTGAIKRKLGRFELADKGTLFLDEIGDISPATQVKLLRVLQEREFERVGVEETLSVDVRVIAATHQSLLEKMEKGLFREDLYYRLHVIPIEIPPLRERKEDIPELAVHFLAKMGQETNQRGLRMDEKAMQWLVEYDWPGNVRELENVIERAVVLCEGNVIRMYDLPTLIAAGGQSSLTGEPQKLNETLERVERQLIEKAIAQANGVKTEAAKILGIKTSALYYKLDKYGLMQGEEQ